jgi:hypothetical protein
MFTMVDFERARNSIKTSGTSILDSLLFSVQKDEFAYAMNLCDSHDRGTYAERLVGFKLMDRGLNVEFFGAAHDYDLLINDAIRAEVKLGTIQPNGKKKTKYMFHKIKPECFDIIFMVFLNPNGVHIKWTTDEMFNEWKVDYTRGKYGYTTTFNGNMDCAKLIYNDTLDSFIGYYAKMA